MHGLAYSGGQDVDVIAKILLRVNRVYNFNGHSDIDYNHLKDIVEELGGDSFLLDCVLLANEEIKKEKAELADYTDEELEEMRYKPKT